MTSGTTLGYRIEVVYPGPSAATKVAITDNLGGGVGCDRVFGGFRPDLMRGGLGRDRCFGGLGRDREQSC